MTVQVTYQKLTKKEKTKNKTSWVEGNLNKLQRYQSKISLLTAIIDKKQLTPQEYKDQRNLLNGLRIIKNNTLKIKHYITVMKDRVLSINKK